MKDHRLMTELEFRLSKDSLEVLKISLAMLPFDVTFIDDRICRCMVSDVPLEDADLYKHVVPQRFQIAELFEAAGLTYTYYGTRLKAYGVCDTSHLVSFANVVDGDVFGISFDTSKEAPGKNVAMDVFDTSPKTGVSIVNRKNIPFICLDKKVDVRSFRAMKHLVSILPDLPSNVAWRPVPGCSMNLFEKSMLEVVYGWIPRCCEYDIFTSLRFAFSDEKMEERPIDSSYLPIFSSKGKCSISLLSGWTYPSEVLKSLPLCHIDPVLQGDAWVFFDLL